MERAAWRAEINGQRLEKDKTAINTKKAYSKSGCIEVKQTPGLKSAAHFYTAKQSSFFLFLIKLK
ncbi:hypothetical protein KIS4809_2794 [Bacillus sp. ZZV12-4809]|nr:hypothetical protein KIS4809_2794 [Bacillus sp. ZZV12-4809]